jgi:hypothetical protein
MKRAEAWEHFVTNYAQPAARKKIMALEEYFGQHQEELIAEFLESFREICLKIKAMQSVGAKGKIACITYSMLRTAILDRRPVYLVEAFNKEWFLDPVECQTRYPAGWAFQFLDQLGPELAEQLKSLYLHQIDRTKPERYLLQESEKYHQYVIRLARYAVDQVAQLPEFQAIEKEAEFAIRVGEYLDESEVVYKEIPRITDPVAIKARFEADDKRLAYTYKVFTDLNLPRGDYWGIKLDYADLRGSNLSESQMQYSNLTGAKFERGSLAESDLTGAWIYEANFGECNLRGANLTEVCGAAVVLEVVGWWCPGFQPVNFRGAKLEGANFKDARLHGANFSGANLRNANFEGADLENAVFAKADSEHLNLDEVQRRGIIWE